MKSKPLILQLIFCLVFSTSAFGENIEKDTMFKIETTTDELPGEILDLDMKAWTSHKGTPYELTIVITNDNITAKTPVGDDFGYTHGLKIVGSKKTEKGITIQLAYTSDLYSSKAGIRNADGETPQYFTDENLARLIFDNKEKKRLWYWKAEVGWHQLNNEISEKLFYASAQQDFWHNFRNKYDPTRIPLPLEEGRGRQNGMMADAAIGLQKEVHVGRLDLKAGIEAGSRQSKLHDADYDYAALELGSSLVILKEVKLALAAEAKAMHHDGGTEYNYSLDATLQIKHWKFGVGMTQLDGELNNYVTHNNPSIRTGELDPIYRAYATYRFGSSKKRK